MRLGRNCYYLCNSSLTNTQKSTTMEKEFIAHLLRNASVNNDRLIEFINSMCGESTDELFRIMSYLTMFSDIPELPETSNIRKGARLVSFDFFKNEVEYAYPTSETYEAPEEFFHLNDTVYEKYCDVPRELRAKCTRKANGNVTVHYTDTTTCSISRWLEE